MPPLCSFQWCWVVASFQSDWSGDEVVFYVLSLFFSRISLMLWLLFLKRTPKEGNIYKVAPLFTGQTQGRPEKCTYSCIKEPRYTYNLLLGVGFAPVLKNPSESLNWRSWKLFNLDLGPWKIAVVVLLLQQTNKAVGDLSYSELKSREHGKQFCSYKSKILKLHFTSGPVSLEEMSSKVLEYKYLKESGYSLANKQQTSKQTSWLLLFKK